jgi:hypothetical protein
MTTVEPFPIPRVGAGPTAVDCARVAAEAVRALNHATLSRHGYEWPADVDATLGALELLADRLPQALRQAEVWLWAEHTAGRVGHDHDADVTVAVGELLGHLEHTRRVVADLAAALRLARSVSSHLTGEA